MSIFRGTGFALLVELGLVVVITVFCLGSALRRQAYDVGYAACKAEMSDRALAVWEDGGAEAMRVQLEVVWRWLRGNGDEQIRGNECRSYELRR